MAVIQISKIQQRRGQKLLFGMPQLSSGELAWAVDTQELFIGNGSVTEGAPYVGNTKILTEHDNILELANSYQFAADELAITASVQRSLQDKIDEIEVSILDFGPLPDPSSDHSQYFSLAFEQLFQNEDTLYRKTLVIPNGTYVFKSVLRIPSNVKIKGETQDQVILDVSSFGIEFLTADNSTQFFFTDTNRPENIYISNLTILFTTGSTNISGMKNSKFESVIWTSPDQYYLGLDVTVPILAAQTYDVVGLESSGDIVISGTGVVSSIQVIFDTNITTTLDTLVEDLNTDTTFSQNFEASRLAESLVITALAVSGISATEILTYFTVTVTDNSLSAPRVIDNAPINPVPTEAASGISAVDSAVSWTNENFGTRVDEIVFDKCKWFQTKLGVKAIYTGPFESIVDFVNCDFEICDTGVYLGGYDDSQQNNWTYKDCNFRFIAQQAVWHTYGINTLITDCDFKSVGNGNGDSSNPLTPTVEFGTAFGNSIERGLSDRHQNANITLLSSTVAYPEVSSGGKTSFSNYYFTDVYPTGLTDDRPLAVFHAFSKFIVIDYVLTLQDYVRKGQLTISIDSPRLTAAIADNFTYSPSLITDPGGAMITDFEFSAQLRDNDLDLVVETLLVKYTNPNGPQGFMSYSISYGV